MKGNFSEEFRVGLTVLGYLEVLTGRRNSSLVRRTTSQHHDTRRDKTMKAASAPERLHQWEEQVRKKHSVQAAELAERKRQEDNYFVAMRSRVLSMERVQMAAERNYAAATQIERKKLSLKSRRERELLTQDECTFQPQLFVPTRSPLANARSKYRDIARKETENVVTSSDRKPRESLGPPSQRLQVFDRLYGLAKKQNPRVTMHLQAHKRERNQEREERVDLKTVAAFLERQVQFERVKAEKLEHLAEETRCSFSPEISERSRQLSVLRRAKPLNEQLRDERLRRQRKLERCIGREMAMRPAIPTKKQASASRVFEATDGFQALLLQLQAQEERMKILETRTMTTR